MNTPNTVYTGPFFAFDWRDYHFFAQLDEAPNLTTDDLNRLTKTVRS